MTIKNKLAIFDMDGTLFDTKLVNYKAYSMAINLAGFNSTVDEGYYCKFCHGTSYKTFLPTILKDISDIKIERIHEKKKELYPSLLQYAKKNNQLFCIIDLIAPNYNIALVTTASRKNPLGILKCFNVEEKFDFILTQEDITRTKPDPEGFIKAMSTAGVTADQTIIFEDSEIELQAAKLSGANFFKAYGYN